MKKKTKKAKGKWSLKKKIFVTIGCFFAVCMLVPLIINFFVIAMSSSYIISEEKAKTLNADCIIVLGALVYQDGTLCTMLQDRVDEGIALYKQGAAKKILMSGDHSKTDYDEVNAMRIYAEKRESLPKIFSWTMPAFQLMKRCIVQETFLNAKK